MIMISGAISITDAGISLHTSTGPVTDQTDSSTTVADVPWKDVLGVEAPDDSRCLTIHYIHHGCNNIWRAEQRTVVLEGTGTSRTYSQLIHQHLHELERPQRVQVLINAISGRGDGEAVYRSTVLPLLELAGIHSTVHVTKYHRHMEHIAETMDIDSVDGILVLGGDGSYQELLHALLPRVHRQKGVDILDPGVQLHPIPLFIGVIPTGTGNGIAQGAYGCVDVETAVLHAITSRSRPVNVVSVQSGDEVTYCGLVASLGSWCRLQERADGLRWMGTLRHKVGRISAYLLKNESFEIDVSYKPVVQKSKSLKTNESEEDSKDYRRETSSSTGINVFPPGFFEDDSRSKLRWNQDGDGMLVVMETPSNRWRYATWMKDMQSMQSKALHYDFIQSCHASHMKVTLKNIQERHRKISVDGEIRPLTSDEVHFQVHRNAINLVSSPTSELNI